MTVINPFLADSAADAGEPVAPPCKSARSALAVVRLSGADALAFLHGQFSADLRTLDVGDTLVTAWLSPKGRVLFMPRLVRSGAQDWFALLPATQGAAFVKRLRMFVLRAKVDVEDCTASHGVMVIDGAAPPSLADAEVVVARDADRAWLIGARAALATLWDASSLTAQNATAASLTDIARGEVQLDVTLSDEFLPQELDLDARQGVSFNKGCYPGQEIVARVKFRGSVKRRVQRLRATIGSSPAAGTRLLGDDQAHRGTVLVSAAREDGAIEMLAVVDIDSGTLHLADAPGARLEVLPLPYAAPGA